MNDCKCKYCCDGIKVKTTKEIGESYNHSCKYHSERAKSQWMKLDAFYQALSNTNARLYQDGEGSYEWNEILCEELELLNTQNPKNQNEGDKID